MTIFFGIILVIIGPDFLIELTKNKTLTGNAALKQGQDFFFYVLYNCFQFAVYLTILQLGVRTFVAELTTSFQGISNKLIKGSVPGVDCAVTFGFGSTNAVTIGFLAGAVGQFLAIAILLLIKSPVLVVAGFVPLFFDNAVIGVYSNNKGGLKACLILPFICGLCQVFGSALIASWVQMYAFGGYLGMFDWAVIWPAFTVIMKYLGWIGVAVVAIILIVIPQLQYMAAPKDENGKSTYFLEVEDYEKYKEYAKKAEEAKIG
jgi:PTS system ascorbate-specific IIC component